MLMHRWIIEFVDGPLLPGEVVMHLCDNPPCFRYDHLRRATQTENIVDAVIKGRHRYEAHAGETNGQAKITEDDVRSIRRRRAAGELRETIAASYGISVSQVTNIALRRKWGHVE
jgi:hypothetical protein